MRILALKVIIWILAWDTNAGEEAAGAKGPISLESELVV